MKGSIHYTWVKHWSNSLKILGGSPTTLVVRGISLGHKFIKKVSNVNDPPAHLNPFSRVPTMLDFITNKYVHCEKLLVYLVCSLDFLVRVFCFLSGP